MVDYVRLMGTVVDIASQSPPPPSSEIGRVSDSENLIGDASLPPDDGSATTHLVHFMMDDGTGSIIDVVTERRLAPTTNGNYRNHSSAKVIHPMTQQEFCQSSTMESILSTPPPPIMVGQTVDCVGRVQIDVVGAGPCVGETNNEEKRILLVASSVSLVTSPQAMTLRHLEICSSTPRWKTTSNGRLENAVARNVNFPQNRILVGGYLERKLNPLYHCDLDGSVVVDMETAFNYIKHSKDDGGITQKELASLVGAVEPNEILAVNLAVEQLREECRIYINQGKWFPM